MREVVRVALGSIAARFSDDASMVDERVLRSRYSALTAWPADAELGLMLLAWMLGPGFPLAGFREAVNRCVPDFVAAAHAVQAACKVGGSPTLVTVIGIVRCTFTNAETVVRWNLNPEVLYWPLDLMACIGATYG